MCTSYTFEIWIEIKSIRFLKRQKGFTINECQYPYHFSTLPQLQTWIELKLERSVVLLDVSL